MYKLQNLNVVKYVSDEASKNRLLAHGYKLVETAHESVETPLASVSVEETPVKKAPVKKSNNRKSVK